MIENHQVLRSEAKEVRDIFRLYKLSLFIGGNSYQPSGHRRFQRGKFGKRLRTIQKVLISNVFTTESFRNMCSFID